MNHLVGGPRFRPPRHDRLGGLGRQGRADKPHLRAQDWGLGGNAGPIIDSLPDRVGPLLQNKRY